MLSDEDFALKMSIPDATEKFDNSEALWDVSEMCFYGDEYNGHLAWKRAWDHADYLNEQHNEDHISFTAVKYCQNYFVMDKADARKLKLIP
jgi:hypothetical protein